MTARRARFTNDVEYLTGFFGDTEAAISRYGITFLFTYTQPGLFTQKARFVLSAYAINRPGRSEVLAGYITWDASNVLTVRDQSEMEGIVNAFSQPPQPGIVFGTEWGTDDWANSLQGGRSKEDSGELRDERVAVFRAACKRLGLPVTPDDRRF
jgi:hypothetical protein